MEEKKRRELEKRESMSDKRGETASKVLVHQTPIPEEGTTRKYPEGAHAMPARDLRHVDLSRRMARPGPRRRCLLPPPLLVREPHATVRILRWGVRRWRMPHLLLRRLPLHRRLGPGDGRGIRPGRVSGSRGARRPRRLRCHHLHHGDTSRLLRRVWGRRRLTW